MPKLSEILSKIEDNVKVQFLASDCIDIKDKKRTNDTEITFATTEVNCNSWVAGNKTALVVWVDKDEYNRAIKESN